MTAKDTDTQNENPTVFVSYSHDSPEHCDWVLDLSTRLVRNGVEVVLDRWDATLGSDLQSFMEKAAAESPRIIAIVSESYRQKANERSGGVGIEKNVLSSRIIQDQQSNIVIPLLRNNPDKRLPHFLANTQYINFNSDDDHEIKYRDLIYDLYGESVIPTPPLGESPFKNRDIPTFITLQESSTKYQSQSHTGTVEFDYTNNNGHFTLGTGIHTFESKWSGAGSRSVHAYSDSPSIRSIALAETVSQPSELRSLSEYDFSSRSRQPEVDDCVIWLNIHGQFALTRIDEVNVSHSKPRKHSMKMTFWLGLEDGPISST